MWPELVKCEGRLVRELSEPEIRSLQVGCLQAVAGVCDRLGITYMLDFGTLLGARRHGGFIPWDDDIDISMPTEDYYAFLIAANEHLPQRYRVSLNPHGERFMKVCILGTRIVENSSLLDPANASGCLYIDVFEMAAYRNITRGRGLARRASYVSHIHATSRKHARQLWSKDRAKAAILFAMSFVPLSLVQRLPKRLLEADAPMSPATPLGHSFGTGFGPEYFPYGDVFPLRSIEFEGVQYPAPQDVDAYLTLRYGDWQIPPPAGARSKHILSAAIDDDWAP